MTKKAFAEKLKQAFKEKGLTQKEVAQIFGVRQEQVSKWLSGKSQPTLDKFEKILEVFGRDANYFFDSPQITHSGAGDIAVKSSIKKSPDNPPDFQLLLSELRALKKEIKKAKK